MPAATADSSISPDSRVSRMTRTRGRAVPRSRSRWVAARARPRASSAVRNSPATPRTLSVPNSFRAKPAALTLAELRALARLLQAGLLAFLGPGVAREEASALELATQVGVGLEQRARDAVTQRAGLRGDAAAVHAGDDVHAVLVADGLQRLADRALQGGAREVGVERLAVDRVCPVARLEDHAGDRALALAGGGVGGAGGEVDRRLGDRLVGLLLGGQGGLGLLALLVGQVGQRVLALADDVDLEVGAGDLGPHARSGRLIVLLAGGSGLRAGSGLGCLALGLDAGLGSGSRDLVGDGLLGGRLRLGLGGRLSLSLGRGGLLSLSHRLGGRGGVVLDRRGGDLGRLVGLGLRRLLGSVDGRLFRLLRGFLVSGHG